MKICNQYRLCNQFQYPVLHGILGVEELFVKMKICNQYRLRNESAESIMHLFLYCLKYVAEQWCILYPR